jgi:hypothetical protein
LLNLTGPGFREWRGALPHHLPGPYVYVNVDMDTSIKPCTVVEGHPRQ